MFPLDNLPLFQFFLLSHIILRICFFYFMCTATPSFGPAFFRYFRVIFFICSHEASISFHSFLFLFSHTSLPPFFLQIPNSTFMLLHSMAKSKTLELFHRLSLPSLFVFYFYLLVILLFIYLIFYLVFDHLYLLQFYFKCL